MSLFNRNIITISKNYIKSSFPSSIITSSSTTTTSSTSSIFNQSFSLKNQRFFSLFNFTRMSSSVAISNNNIWKINELLNEINKLEEKSKKKLDNANTKIFNLESTESSTSSSTDTLRINLENNIKNLEGTLDDIDNLKLLIKEKKKIDLNDNTNKEIIDLLQRLKITKEKPLPTPPSSNNNKKKEKKNKLPYFLYNSHDNIEIRVGKSAADNDILSIDKDYRDDNDWWLHVSNYPGSHVVIRYQDDDLESKYPITLIEAALLAIKSSKVPLTNEIKLTLSRPKYVKKLINYKDGLVCVTKSSVLKINYNKEKHRLDSLKKITSN